MMDEERNDGGKRFKPHAEAERAAIERADDEVEAQIFANILLDGRRHD